MRNEKTDRFNDAKLIARNYQKGKRIIDSLEFINSKNRQIVFIHNIATSEIYWSGAFQEITGFKKNNFNIFNLSRFLKIIHHDDREAVRQCYESILADRSEETIYFRMITNVEKVLYMEARWSYKYGSKEDDHDWIVGNIKDVSQQKATETALKRTKERYESLFKFSPEAICLVTPRWTIRDMNECCLDLLGIRSREEIRDKEITEFIYPDDWQKLDIWCKSVNNDIEFLLKNPKLEYRVITRRGHIRHILTSSGPIYNFEGDLDFIEVGISDITDLKNAEQERERLIEDLRNAYSELKEKQDKLIRIEKINAVLAMNVTTHHEINQPLAIIKGYSGLLRKAMEDSVGIQKEKYCSYLEKMDESVIKIQDLLKKFLDIEKIAFEDYIDGVKMVKIENGMKRRKTDQANEPDKQGGGKG